MREKLLIIACILLAACNKQLDLAPEDTLVEKDVFKTEAGADQALSEAYYNLSKAITGGIAYSFGDFTTDNLKRSSYYETWNNADVTPADDQVKGIWQGYYSAINTANNIIFNIPGYGKFDQSKQDQFIAEAKFIRAFAYLDLLRFFGAGALTGDMNGLGLPLQLTPFQGYNTGEVIPRSSNADVYAQITKDLREAIQSLPDNHSNDLKTRSRATKGSANALLARALLYARKYSEAAEAAKLVIDKTSIYSLTANLLQLFPSNSGGTAQTLTPEYVFAFPISQMVSSSTSANNNLGNAYFYKRSFWINPDFISKFETGDTRVSQLMFKGDTIYNTDRFQDRTTFKFNNPNGRDNVPLIRLAEVMLIRAEALARTNGVNSESVQILNAIRSRSVPGATAYTTNSFNTGGDLLKKIMEQRRFELAFEGFYRYDLIRDNQPLRVPDVPQNKKTLPIPQIEIDISHGLIQQNPGY